MATPITLSQALSVPDILDSSRFLLLLPRPSGVGGDIDMLSIKCFSASIPGEQNESFDVTMSGGFTRNFRGRRIFTTSIAFGFYEDSDAETLRVLRQWKQITAGTETNNSVDYLSGYSVDAELHQFDTIGQTAILNQIFAMYPVDISEISLSSEASSPLQIQATFRCQRLETNLAKSL